ncbi:MAG: CBS domain-containing protein [Chromatiaceae bacterium]|nr:MAG: CBS domain-containing protein [Chromatiaceae bacterium]
MTAPDTPAAGAAVGDAGPDQAPLRSLPRRRPVLVAPDTPVRETLFRIGREHADAAVVTDRASGLPLGLITLNEMLQIIGGGTGDLDEPVAAYMIGAPLTVAADAAVHRAKVMMAKQGVTHLLLTEPDGRLFGLIGQGDLLGLRAGGADALVAAINAARDVQAMAEAADRVRRRAADLFHSGMPVEALCQWLSGLNDLLGMRIIELIEDEFELPAVPWCWLAFGSEGRLEQTFATDQDNGLIFVPPAPNQTAACRDAFLPFCQAVNEALHFCGFERCRGGIMAGNPDWCLSDLEWQGRFADWLRVPDPEALLHGTIFFDFRPLYGSYELVDRLRGWLIEAAPGHDRFFHNLAQQTLSVSPPLGWAGQFSYGRNRDFPHTIDLKLEGARLFTDPARLWAVRHGLWATSTAERLRAVAAVQGRSAADTAAEIEAFHLIQRFRIQQQLSARDPDAANRVDPDDLNELHRLMLKEALKQAKRLQLRLRQEYSA